MQFPVPQFTDVEDKIIGMLTLKQFGIVFAAGVVIFLGYSATKSILVLIFLFMLFGVPALALAFVPYNGRPIYNTLGNFVKFLSSPKVLIFHKEARNMKSGKDLKDAEVASAKTSAEKVVPIADTQANLKQVQELLKKTASDERDIAGRMK